MTLFSLKPVYGVPLDRSGAAIEVEEVYVDSYEVMTANPFNNIYSIQGRYVTDEYTGSFHIGLEWFTQTELRISGLS